MEGRASVCLGANTRREREKKKNGLALAGGGGRQEQQTPCAPRKHGAEREFPSADPGLEFKVLDRERESFVHATTLLEFDFVRLVAPAVATRLVSAPSALVW